MRGPIRGWRTGRQRVGLVNEPSFQADLKVGRAGHGMNPQAELDKLIGMFPGEDLLISQAEHLASAMVPEPYRGLLAHNHHMTVTMEAYYGVTVDVEVLDRQQAGEIYGRKILLRRSDTHRVVQFGLVRFDFQYVTAAVRDEILAEKLPLGRVLINHNVLRHIDLGAVLKLTPGPQLARLFDCREKTDLYGRLATIFCNGKPAVDLLEIAAPVEIVRS